MSVITKILIVDDHPVFRRGLREVIEENAHFQVVGEASDGAEALGLMTTLKPHIAIVDIDMPHLNGLELLRALRKVASPVLPVILTMYKDQDV